MIHAATKFVLFVDVLLIFPELFNVQNISFILKYIIYTAKNLKVYIEFSNLSLLAYIDHIRPDNLKPIFFFFYYYKFYIGRSRIEFKFCLHLDTESTSAFSVSLFFWEEER